ncbi:MAG: hypothetical protein RL514_4675 [Verrucomicrobiota bacterium]|jgi:competence protein ComGC
MSEENLGESGLSRQFWVSMMVILTLAVAVALPNFIKARATRAKAVCAANLKQIDGAVQQWALENKKVATDTYSLSDLAVLAYMKGSTLPVCPGGGRYLAGTVSGFPRCSIGGPGHTL